MITVLDYVHTSITYDIPQESVNKAIELLPVMAQTLQNKGKKVKTFESFNDVTTNFEAPLPVADNFIDSIIDFNTSSATSISSNSFDEIQYTQDNEHHQCCTRC